jgi:hypothetical protein
MTHKIRVLLLRLSEVQVQARGSREPCVSRWTLARSKVRNLESWKYLLLMIAIVHEASLAPD